MVIPQMKHIYLYEGKKYIVRYCAMIDPILSAQTCEDNEKSSTFQTFNYWKFAFKAKHIGEEKLGKAY